MRTLFLLCALLVVALPAGATVYTDYPPSGYTENFESYSTGALNGQSGWSISSGNSRANVFSPDNGPSLSGSKCVKLDNLVSGSTGIQLFKTITDLVATQDPHDSVRRQESDEHLRQVPHNVPHARLRQRVEQAGHRQHTL
jgi:hypothetical protein